MVLVGTGDSVRTDSSGQAIFSVSPGRYLLRAYGIQREGPVLQHIDFDVDARKGETTFVNFPCVVIVLNS